MRTLLPTMRVVHQIQINSNSSPSQARLRLFCTNRSHYWRSRERRGSRSLVVSSSGREPSRDRGGRKTSPTITVPLHSLFLGHDSGSFSAFRQPGKIGKARGSSFFVRLCSVQREPRLDRCVKVDVSAFFRIHKHIHTYIHTHTLSLSLSRSLSLWFFIVQSESFNILVIVLQMIISYIALAQHKMAKNYTAQKQVNYFSPWASRR